MNLAQYRKCFNATEEQFTILHDIDSGSIAKNVRYERLTDVTRVALVDNQFFFFKDSRLKLIYISDDATAQQLWRDFKSGVNAENPEEIVRSRAGKTSNQEIFATHGIAASITKGEVDFIEIFPPCLLEEYLQSIYKEPEPFIR
jgi:hypothetical protein